MFVPYTIFGPFSVLKLSFISNQICQYQHYAFISESIIYSLLCMLASGKKNSQSCDSLGKIQFLQQDCTGECLGQAQYNPSKNLASKKFNHLKLPKIVRTVQGCFWESKVPYFNLPEAKRPNFTLRCMRLTSIWQHIQKLPKFFWLTFWYWVWQFWGSQGPYFE